MVEKTFLDKYLKKFVAITQKDDFRKSGLFVSYDDDFIYLEFSDKTIHGISKDEIKFISELRERV